ncbi:MFS general substrate transporter [Aspergillus japonicus CBS 114.51]|uniref:MFS general substrate transporter n=3 Tax=Aspergillus TaxID=5052 RepID=A0A2V5I619_ASPV1|nr:MFS general substrate transporter [Aspergillus japonicus CBS 114.51]PYI23950.1 MFS general substrate transporter [Aspergillus violaceofuscus CBS 115571]RAH87258.1 MFS general substrate transporter [Aspergillus japonicus CBS 114.51]
MPSSAFNGSTGSHTLMWPPGTSCLADISPSTGDAIINLQPRPSDDPNDPLNWTPGRKYWNMGLVCFYVAMVAEFINASTPTWGPMESQLGFSDEIMNDSYAAGCAGLAVGSLVLIPFALKFGRRPLYLFSTVVQFGICIWSAKIQTVGDLMAVNVIQCFFASLAEAIVQMTIADLFFVHQRGRMNALYVWTWLLSTYLGILVAGFVADGLGWRWIWWLNAIICGVTIFVVAFGYEETKFCPRPVESAMTNLHPVLSDENTSGAMKFRNHDTGEDGAKNLNDKSATQRSQSDAEKSARELGSVEAAEDSRRETTPRPALNPNIPMKTYWQRLALITPTTSSGAAHDTFFQHMFQPLCTGSWWPWAMSCRPRCPPTYPRRPTTSPPTSLPRMIGVTIGAIIVGPLSDWWIVYLARRRHGIFQPETRLWCMIPFLPFVVVGAVLFAIGLSDHRPWPVIAVGLALYNIGVTPINTLTITYLTDSYREIIGDALVGVTLTRNTFSTVFIFALSPWVARVGLKDTFVTILVLAVAILLAFVVFLRYGKSLRGFSASRYLYYAARQYKERSG